MKTTSRTKYSYKSILVRLTDEERALVDRACLVELLRPSQVARRIVLQWAHSKLADMSASHV